jgi:hypothetical protein
MRNDSISGAMQRRKKELMSRDNVDIDGSVGTTEFVQVMER